MKNMKIFNKKGSDSVNRIHFFFLGSGSRIENVKDPDPVGPERWDPDPVNIRQDPKPCRKVTLPNNDNNNLE